MDLGDNQPSFPLRQIREIEGQSISDELLITLWIQRLPLNVQQILLAYKGELNELATMADRILETSPVEICATTNNSHSRLDTDLINMINKLEEKIKSLSSEITKMRRS